MKDNVVLNAIINNKIRSDYEKELKKLEKELSFVCGEERHEHDEIEAVYKKDLQNNLENTNGYKTIIAVVEKHHAEISNKYKPVINNLQKQINELTKKIKEL